MKSRTIRELGGEIWLGLGRERELLLAQGDERLKNLDWQTLNASIDVIMGILARHEDTVIINDFDLPVEPLARR